MANENETDGGIYFETMERRCRRHPHVVISSPDGLFDGLCGECEAYYDACEAEDERQARAEQSRNETGHQI